MTKKACIYVRVSTAAQSAEEKVSLKQQEADCRELCDSKGYAVVSVLSDVASGSTKKRPQFQRMLEGIAEGEYDVVVAWSTDRLSRSIYATVCSGGWPRSSAPTPPLICSPPSYRRSTACFRFDAT